MIATAGGKGPRQTIWGVIRALKAEGVETWGGLDIWANLSREERRVVSSAAIRDYLTCLTAAGILACEARRYRLVKDEGLEAPRVKRDGSRVTTGLAQEQMWRALRMMSGDFNTRELAAYASTPAVPVAIGTASGYLLNLHAAGYLTRTKEGKGGLSARYRLKASRDTGPRPPVVSRARVVYDPNEDKIVWQAPVSEEDVIHGR